MQKSVHDYSNSCCAPSRIAHESDPTSTQNILTDTGDDGNLSAAVPIPGGPGLVGTNSPAIVEDGEGPMRTTRIKAISIDRSVVTNARFKEFVDATGYVTEAETLGSSFCFFKHLPKLTGKTQAVVSAEWWRIVDGANWRLINGPNTQDAWHADHPVVHVSWHDANAYAKWSGGRLPTEAEWEHAARGGLGDIRFPWGDEEPDDTGFFPCNIWQGRFPANNTERDGYAATAPAKSYDPNGYGLFNMAGNVWEWTSEPFKVRSLKKSVQAFHADRKGFKLLKGGSFLCHISYCYRYRIAARTGNSANSSTSHQGFRLVYEG